MCCVSSRDGIIAYGTKKPPPTFTVARGSRVDAASGSLRVDAREKYEAGQRLHASERTGRAGGVSTLRDGTPGWWEEEHNTPGAPGEAVTGTIVYVSDEQVPGETTSSAPPPRAIFRMPRTAVIAAVLTMMCATPFAWSAPPLTAVYLLPIGFIAWVIRYRTIADAAEGITVRTLSVRTYPWQELRGFAIEKRGRVRASLAEGKNVALPFVRARHLPVIATVSGGRVADPTAPTKES
ncbi:MAG: hypothetical protein GEU86_06600 [Actinophytocola sp.]|nr:hypothetical protein [Actinophytocola sp.]